MAASMFGVTGINECKDESGKTTAGVITYPKGKTSSPMLDMIFAAAFQSAPEAGKAQARKIDGKNWDVFALDPQIAREIQSVVGGTISEFDPPAAAPGGFGSSPSQPQQPVELSLGQDSAATINGVTANVTVDQYITGGSSDPNMSISGKNSYPASAIEVTICPMTAQPVELTYYEQGFMLRTDDGRTASSYGFFEGDYDGFPADIPPIDASGTVQQGSCANGLLVFDEPMNNPDDIALTGTMQTAPQVVWSVDGNAASTPPAAAPSVPGDTNGDGVRSYEEGGPRPNVTCAEANVPGCATAEEEKTAQSQQPADTCLSDPNDDWKCYDPAKGEWEPPSQHGGAS